ncbi:hypothetical protein SEVIR_2G233150v4 [Setaria viridis]
MLWTPALVPKGCFLNDEGGREVVRCRTGEALHQAKSLVNLQFSRYLSGAVVFVVVLYLQMARRYLEEPLYVPVVKEDSGGGDSDGRFNLGDDLEDGLEAGKGEFAHVIGSASQNLSKSNAEGRILSYKSYTQIAVMPID